MPTPRLVATGHPMLASSLPQTTLAKFKYPVTDAPDQILFPISSSSDSEKMTTTNLCRVSHTATLFDTYPSE